MVKKSNPEQEAGSKNLVQEDNLVNIYMPTKIRLHVFTFIMDKELLQEQNRETSHSNKMGSESG